MLLLAQIVKVVMETRENLSRSPVIWFHLSIGGRDWFQAGRLHSSRFPSAAKMADSAAEMTPELYRNYAEFTRISQSACKLVSK